MTTPNDDALSSYEKRVLELKSLISRDEALSKRLVRLRVGTALPGLAMVVVGLLEPKVGSWVWQLGVLLIAVFLGFATWYEFTQWSIERTRSQLFGFERLNHRCRRTWSGLVPLACEEECKPFVSEWTKDLDVFGERSLFRWCSLAMTHTGAKTVAKWITEWVSPNEIRERQQAVRELVPFREWRLRFYQIACGMRNQRTSPEAIAYWTQTKDFFEGRVWLYGMTWIGPILIVISSIVLFPLLGMEYNVWQLISLGGLLLGLAINLVLTMTILGPIHDLFHRIGAANRELQTFRDWIAEVREMPHSSGLLREYHHSLLDPANDSFQALTHLRYHMFLAGFQRSPLFFIPYVVLQLLCLWDVRILMRLEQWKRSFGVHMQIWVDSLGKLEALCSAAAIADEYPEWTYPEIRERGALLRVVDVAHPLLKDDQRVPNNLAISESQRLLLVTGSNMAGKSTLLRSIGVNSVLARLGAPVCASTWVSESFEIASSIRVQDSLQDGVSFFMAELKRLRAVVDRAVLEHRPDGQRMLVLLDEILQGTNSRERQIAVDSVLRRLVDLECIVMASTHDLDLASNDQMKSAAQIVHFREYFELVEGKQVMRFDYIMRPGVTPTTNALKLLELVGL